MSSSLKLALLHSFSQDRPRRGGRVLFQESGFWEGLGHTGIFCPLDASLCTVTVCAPGGLSRGARSMFVKQLAVAL